MQQYLQRVDIDFLMLFVTVNLQLVTYLKILYACQKLFQKEIKMVVSDLN